MLAFLLLTVAQALSPAPPTRFDKVIALEIGASDAVLAGHGRSKRVEYVAEFSGTLHVWTRVESERDASRADAVKDDLAAEFDLFLRIEDQGGKLIGEDDNSGGGKTPYVKFAVEPGTKLAITVASANSDGTGKLELHLVAAPETATTRAEAEQAKLAILEIRRLRAAKDLATARARSETLAEHLVGVEGGSLSEAIAEQAWLAQVETYPLAVLVATERLRRLVLLHRWRTLPGDHTDLQRVRGNYANTIRARGDRAGALPLQEQVLAAFLRTFPDEHPNVQSARLNLAITLGELGDLPSARALQAKVVEVRSRTLPDDDLALQSARTGLAATLEELGDLKGARTLQEKVLEILLGKLPDDDTNLQAARQNLANTLTALGDLDRARSLAEKVLDVRLRTQPDEHPDLQGARLNLAAIFWILGDLAGARSLDEKVLEVCSRTLPDDDRVLQATRENLSLVRRSLGDVAGARSLQEKVVEVRSRTLPDDNRDLQMARGNLAGTLLMLDDFEGARSLGEKVLEVWSRTLPDTHPLLQTARANLAVTLRLLGDLAGERALEEEVLEGRSRTLPNDHVDVQRARANLAFTLAAEQFQRQGKRAGEGAKSSELDEGVKRFRALASAYTRGLTRSAQLAILSASSREAEERCASLTIPLDEVLSFAAGLGVFPADPDLTRAAFLLSETSRDAAQASASLVRRARGDERYEGLRERLRAASGEVTGLAQGGGTPDEFSAALARHDQAERELVNLAGELPGGGRDLVEFDLDSLARRIAPREALVAYRRYTHWVVDPGAPKMMLALTESLCAFVMHAGGKLDRVEIGASAPIETAVNEWRDLLEAPLDRGLAVGLLEDHARRVRAGGAALRRLVIDPLLPVLGDVDHLVVALDDMLHAVPIDALPLDPDLGPGTPAGGSGKPSPRTADLLGERFMIEQRLSLREISWKANPLQSAQTLVALGGASFNSEPLASNAEEPSEEGTTALVSAREGQSAVPSLLREGMWERGFDPLTYTGLEARGIAALFDETFGNKAHEFVLEKRKASRDSLAELAPKARWLHLATHGWFARESIKSWSDPEPMDKLSGLMQRMGAEEQVKGMSPMLLCGLALAGANLPANAIGRYPGLVTAEEIASWDLSNCELVVVSACETNRGERRAGQGVASLQKALQMAGARSVITSLWKVPDEATKDLMLNFYRRLWVEKKPKWQALWEAKNKLREARDESGKLKYTTRDWAAWVLTGEPN